MFSIFSWDDFNLLVFYALHFFQFFLAREWVILRFCLFVTENEFFFILMTQFVNVFFFLFYIHIFCLIFVAVVLVAVFSEKISLWEPVDIDKNLKFNFLLSWKRWKSFKEILVIKYRLLFFPKIFSILALIKCKVKVIKNRRWRRVIFCFLIIFFLN